MKKLLIVVPRVHGQIYTYLRALDLNFTEIFENQFVYTGYCEPWDKVSYLIKEYHPIEFTFLENENYYVFRVWKE